MAHCNCPSESKLMSNVGLQGLRGSTGLAGIVWNLRHVEAPLESWFHPGQDEEFSQFLSLQYAGVENIPLDETVVVELDIGAPLRARRVKLGGRWIPYDGPVTIPPGADSGFKTWGVIGSVVATASVAASAYHGWKRTESIGWTIGWALFGAVLPIVAVPVALAQGFGKRKRG